MRPKPVLTIVFNNGARSTVKTDGSIKRVQSPWCSVEGCARTRVRVGMCTAHEFRWRRTGSPGTAQIGKTRGRPFKDEVTYNSAHLRLIRSLGPASGYRCPCGAWASDYAYLGGDPDERTETVKWSDGRTNTVAYTLDPTYMKPLCRSCHSKHDRWGQPIPESA